MGISVQLIVGLGNPGSEYEQTRHNAGANFVLALSEQYQATLQTESKFFGSTARITIEEQDIRLLIPNTYMNLSGKSIVTMARFYQINPEKILVIHDDLDLNPGISRFKIGGGHGGHNGLKDTIKELGNNANFSRLRIGIGDTGNAREVVNFVLKKAPQCEQQLRNEAIVEAVRVIPLAVSGDWGKAMKELHTQQDS